MPVLYRKKQDIKDVKVLDLDHISYTWLNVYSNFPFVWLPYFFFSQRNFIHSYIFFFKMFIKVTSSLKFHLAAYTICLNSWLGAFIFSSVYPFFSSVSYLTFVTGFRGEKLNASDEKLKIHSF